ncbi:uncharacterized protein LOC144664006 isoform X3 [Oculina patagonica]
MASAAPPPVASTKETTNYARLCRLLVDVGSQALTDTFDGIHPPAGLHLVLARNPAHATLQTLRARRILNPTQWGKLYPTIPSSVSSASLDITLLMVLLRNICGLHAPVTGWDSLPPPADTSKEANIARVKYYRNTVYGHASQASVDDATFNTYWQDISNALVALGGASYGAAILKLKNECMDPDTEEHYRELLKQWKKDEDNIKDKLDEIEITLKNNQKELLKQLKEEKSDIKDKLGELEENIKERLEEMENQVKNVSEKLDSLTGSSQDEDQARDDFQQMRIEIRNIAEKLNTQISSREVAKDEENAKDKLEEMKVEIRHMEEKLDTLMSRAPPVGREPELEDVFDPAEIIDGIRQLYKLREGWLAPFPWCEEFHFHLDDIFTKLKVVSRKKTRGTATTDTVNMSGIFKPHEECPQPRTVLIEGKPGMGKTTYCKKLVYDWATGKQKAENGFPRFETVMLLRCRDMKSDLWEAIDDQLLPRDVKEDVKERFFNFIRQNQSNVLLILDGLDEVPANKMPMFSEIIQGRILPKCRLVATARHEAGMKVRIHCDTLLDIEGFTEEDARKFIVKYFKTMKDLAQNLLSMLQNDEHLNELTANPLNTALLCLVCEEFQGIFPESRTKLYMDIVQCVLRRYIQKKGLPENNDDLIESYKPRLKHLGWIALKGLREDNLDFEESELGSHSADLPGFGFLSVQPGGSKLRPRRRYSFLHKSFQEFFAAFYLCCQLLDKEISADSLAADRRYFHELAEVLMFTCGMIAARCEETTEALVKSLTTQVNHEEDGDCFSVVLEGIKECKKENSDFHIKLARVSGSLLKRKALRLRRITGADAVVLAEALQCNSSLTELVLSNNNIGDHEATGVAEALQNNTSLKVLHLSDNNIGYHGATGLAEALQNNTSLTELNFSFNNIGDHGVTGLAEALKKNTSLTVMHLSHNNIGDHGATALAEALQKNTSLTELNLYINYIGDAGAAGLAEALKKNTSLTELYLSNNYIGDHGATALAEALKKNTSLTALYLSYNDIDDHGAALAEALQNNTSLTELDLSGNNIGDQGAAALAEALQNNTSLTVLYLSDNYIGDHGATGLAEALQNNTSLTVLDLTHNNIGAQGATGLAEALQNNTSLTELNFSFNNIGDHGVTGLAEALKKNTSLTVLYLSGNKIGDHGATALAEALKNNTSLTELYLSYNNIGDHGATALAEALKKNTSLTALYLSNNNIGHHGAAGLAEALQNNTSLTELYLSDNNIGDHGATGLAEALQNNTSLTVLHLSHNNIGDHGATGLAEALKKNTSLTALNLSGNNIGDHDAAGLAEALKKNTSLTKLYLSDSNIGDEGATALAGALRENKVLRRLHLFNDHISEAVISEIRLEHGDRVVFTFVLLKQQ